MANIVQELLIKIGVKSDTSGADQAGAAVEKVGASTEKAAAATRKVSAAQDTASKSAKDLSGALGKNVEVGSQAVTMMTSIEGASKGGAAGLASAARAGLAFFTMLKGALAGAGPIAIAVTVLAALAGGAIALAQAFKEPKKPVEDLGKAIDDLNKERDTKLKDYIEGIGTAAKAARADLEALLSVEEARNDADAAIALANIRADKSLTTEQRLRAEQAVRQQSDKRKAAIEERRRLQDLKDAFGEIDAAQAEVDSAREAAASSAGRAAAAGYEIPTEQETEQLRRRLDLLKKIEEVNYRNADNIFIGSDERAKRLAEARAATEERKAIEDKIDPSKEDAAQRADNLKAAREDAAKQAEKLAEAEKKLAGARAATDALDRKHIAAINVDQIKADAKTKIENIAIKEEADKRTDPKRIADMQRLGYGVSAERYARNPTAEDARILKESFPDRAKEIDRLTKAKPPADITQPLKQAAESASQIPKGDDTAKAADDLAKNMAAAAEAQAQNAAQTVAALGATAETATLTAQATIQLGGVVAQVQADQRKMQSQIAGLISRMNA